jgi:hypothetical protein
MMQNKLAAVQLIRKQFDGNITRIEIIDLSQLREMAPAMVKLTMTDFEPRCDGIPVANLSIRG